MLVFWVAERTAIVFPPRLPCACPASACTIAARSSCVCSMALPAHFQSATHCKEDRATTENEDSMIDFANRPVVLFDFDGTLADTRPMIIDVTRQVIADHGFAQPSEADMLQMIGPPLEEGFHLVCGIPLGDEATAWAQEYRAAFAEGLDDPANYPLIPGMDAILADLERQGKRLAVATSRMEDSAIEMVGRLGLTCFAAVRGRVPGLRYSKAESIAAALDALDAQPGEALMIGDRLHDVEGAHELGVPCIGIYTGAAKPGEHEAAGAEAICHSVDELAETLGIRGLSHSRACGS